MILPPFKYHQPTSVEEAVELAQASDGDFDFIAGGTDVLPNYKNRLNPRGHVISLAQIPKMNDISPESIGAMASLVAIEKNAGLRKKLPVLPETASLVATPLLRESATLGGNILLDTRCWFFNQTFLWRESKGFCLKADGDDCLVVPQKEICYATYSGDFAPVLMVLDASFHLTGPDGSREVHSHKFFTHDGITRNVRLPEEILTHFTLPGEAQSVRCGYRKLRLRDSMDYPVMGAAVALGLNDRTLESLQVAVTGTGTTPFVYNEITERYIGEQLSDELIEDISEAVMEEVKPYRNVHFSPQYRKAMSGVYLQRLLTELRDNTPN